MTTSNPSRVVAVAAAVALLAVGCSSDESSGDGSSINWNPPAAESYHRLATYPVYTNRPTGEPIDTETVAEISTVTPDGNTLIYTDATAKRIGFLDIRDPAKPAGLGALSLAELGHADDQPTSVIAHGEYVLVVVDTTGGDFTKPSGRLDVVRVGDRSRVHSIDLGGQPDSIAIGKDGSFAAVAMENQRDEEFTPAALPIAFVGGGQMDGAPIGWGALGAIVRRPRRRKPAVHRHR